MNKHNMKRYWPEFVVMLVCAILLLHDIGMKKGYHMDELLSFELANGQFNPWIVPTQPQGRLAKFVENEIASDSFSETLSNVGNTIADVVNNRGESVLLSYQADVYEEPVWITREQFKDYITVDSQDDFNYLSVYFNVKDDNHPPLHFMALHTVSSLFKGEINPYMGCCINLLCVLGMTWLLMQLGQMCSTLLGREGVGRAVGLWAGTFYGLSMAALSTVLLIRMYAMMSFFCVALLFIVLKKLYGKELDGTDFTGKNKLLILVTVLGFWTQYFFLFYCLMLAAVTAILLWKQKRNKELFGYIRAMVLAGIIGVVGFPFAISDVFSSGRGVEALQNLSAGLTGYGERLMAFGGILMNRFDVGCLMVPAGAALILWVCKKVTVKKDANSQNDRASADKKCQASELWVVLALPVISYFIMAARMSPYLVDRYIMPVFPFVALLFTLLVTGSFRKYWVYGCILATGVIAICNPGRKENPYLYQDYPDQLAISAQYADMPCICVGEGVGYYENLLEFANYEETLIVTGEELYNRMDQASIDSLDQVVVLVKPTVAVPQVQQCMEETYGFVKSENLLSEGSVYGDRILLFQK